MLRAVGAGAEWAAGMAGPAGAVHNCFAYSRTAAAWPATVTLRQILRMIPALSTTKVMRKGHEWSDSDTGVDWSLVAQRPLPGVVDCLALLLPEGYLIVP